MYLNQELKASTFWPCSLKSKNLKIGGQHGLRGQYFTQFSGFKVLSELHLVWGFQNGMSCLVWPPKIADLQQPLISNFKNWPQIPLVGYFLIQHDERKASEPFLEKVWNEAGQDSMHSFHYWTCPALAPSLDWILFWLVEILNAALWLVVKPKSKSKSPKSSPKSKTRTVPSSFY